jgi:UDP-N-acetylglucosamine 2-epimerase (non-hydrolysing)
MKSLARPSIFTNFILFQASGIFAWIEYGLLKKIGKKIKHGIPENHNPLVLIFFTIYFNFIMKTLKILFVFGTRPEAIKFAPLINVCKKRTNLFQIVTCITAQHRQMLDQVLSFFAITPDFDLDIMKPDQDLFDVTSRSLMGLEKILTVTSPDLIFVQGDTTTAFAGALAGYYKKIKVCHLEAGLRSANKYSPYPEEMNRVLIDHIADYHFAPTDKATQSLYNEGIIKNVWKVGNTVIDALFLGMRMIEKKGEAEFLKHLNFLDVSKRIILITGHRRESFGKPFENICLALKEIASFHPDIELVYPVHLNPNVQEPVYRILKGHANIHLIEPLDYPHLIWLMNKCYTVLTDSGGIQEEAPSLGKPVLVMREVTERTEGIEAGTAKLVGTNKETIIHETNVLLNDVTAYQSMANAVNPYGDGTASEKISEILANLLKFM